VFRKNRGLSSDDARYVRQRGHDDAKEFASLIGLPNDYRNDLKAKKDVIDPSGDAHSVKSGKVKWQIFLYGLSRFETDDAWKAMNGIGQLLAVCIKSFPTRFEEYEKDKTTAKQKLRGPMTELAELLHENYRLRAFINKSMFNGGEVNYLTVKEDGIFHVFLNTDVIDVISNNVSVTNSQARNEDQISDQKIILKYNNKNLAEIEMRNDSEVHYREIRFNMMKPRMMELLFKKITQKKQYNNKVMVYGHAIRRFGRWNG